MKSDQIKVKRNNDSVFEDGFTTALLVARSGGWVTIQTKDGLQYKYRSGQVVEVPFSTPDEVPDVASVPPSIRKLLPKLLPKPVAEPEPSQPQTHIKIGKMVVPKDRYVVTKDVKTSSGRVCVDNGDVVAEKLRGLHLVEVYKLVSVALGVTLPDLEARYRHLNPGMQRMNLGNIYRKSLSK